MLRVSEANKIARRQQIIDAAYRCFVRKGLNQTTMRDIYEEAELSAGAVYHYFDSKDAIIEASFEFDYEHSLAHYRHDNNGDGFITIQDLKRTFQ